MESVLVKWDDKDFFQPCSFKINSLPYLFVFVFVFKSTPFLRILMNQHMINIRSGLSLIIKHYQSGKFFY